MDFVKEITFPGPPDRVEVMLADPEFRRAVAERAGAHSVEIDITESDDGLHTRVESQQPTDQMPGAVRRVAGESLRIDQREHWSTPERGTLEVQVVGTPGEISGQVALAGDDTVTVQTVTAVVTARVPVVGGKVEQYVGRVFGHVLKVQAQVGEEWLAG